MNLKKQSGEFFEVNREVLEQMAEPDYQKFSSSLIPGISRDRILGVRLPKLRELAKKIAKGDWRGYLMCASDNSVEEILLQGMVIGYGEATMSERMERIEYFLPKIDNWSVCDSFCAGLKFVKADRKGWWSYIKQKFKEEEEYSVRFAAVMTLDYFVQEEYKAEALALLSDLHREEYYVKMAVAWALAVFYVAFPEETLYLLKSGELDRFTCQKAIQKIRESKRVSEEEKLIFSQIHVSNPPSENKSKIEESSATM